MRTRTLCPVSALIALCAACTPYGYTKPGMTEQTLAADQLECIGIARQQAFLDNNRDRLAAEAAYAPWRWQAAPYFYGTIPYGTIPTLAERERRYRRVCMLARGYELVPLEEEGEPSRTESGD